MRNGCWAPRTSGIASCPMASCASGWATPQPRSPPALITTLATSVYQDPTQLWTAPTAALPITFSFADKQLTVQSDPNYLGSFTVVVTANDGGQKASQTFTITINHRAPTLADVANQTMRARLKDTFGKPQRKQLGQRCPGLFGTGPAAESTGLQSGTKPRTRLHRKLLAKLLGPAGKVAPGDRQ